MFICCWMAMLNKNQSSNQMDQVELMQPIILHFPLSFPLPEKSTNSKVNSMSRRVKHLINFHGVWLHVEKYSVRFGFYNLPSVCLQNLSLSWSHNRNLQLWVSWKETAKEQNIKKEHKIHCLYVVFLLPNDCFLAQIF